MQPPTPRIIVILLACLTAETQAYLGQGWPMPLPVYNEDPREFTGDDYYDSPKQQYYHQYQSPELAASAVYGHVPYPYMSAPYGSYMRMPEGHEERVESLPVGEEIWYENEAQRPRNKHDVSTAFLDNLILNEMALDAERRRDELNHAAESDEYEISETERDLEDEDVRELKALAGKPIYHVPKTVPMFEQDEDNEEEYPSDEMEADNFINWNGNKRSVKITGTTPPPTTDRPASNAGQKEVMLPGPGQTHKSRHAKLHQPHHKSNQAFYNNVAQLMAKNTDQDQSKGRRIDKRFVSAENDLVHELRGLKHRIQT